MASAVVLAAGESKRMGMKKEVLPIDGEPMIKHVVGRLLASTKIDEVIVVLGGQADEVGTSLAGVLDERLELVGNARYAEGMGTSIAQGVRACSWGASPILIVLGDTPFFVTDDVDALIAAHAGGARIAVPVLDGRRGSPLLLDCSTSWHDPRAWLQLRPRRSFRGRPGTVAFDQVGAEPTVAYTVARGSSACRRQ